MLTAQEMEQLKTCQSAGGCHIVTRAALEMMIDKTIELTLLEVARKSPSCRRDVIVMATQATTAKDGP